MSKAALLVMADFCELIGYSSKRVRAPGFSGPGVDLWSITGLLGKTVAQWSLPQCGESPSGFSRGAWPKGSWNPCSNAQCTTTITSTIGLHCLGLASSSVSPDGISKKAMIFHLMVFPAHFGEGPVGALSSTKLVQRQPDFPKLLHLSWVILCNI